jgi:histone acetyltransferase SAS3
LFERIYRAASGAGVRLNLATAVTYTMAATVPANHEDLRMNSQMDQQLQDAVHKADVGDQAEEDEAAVESESTDESKSEDEEGSSESEDDDSVDAIKLRQREIRAGSEDSESDAEEADPDAIFENGSDAKSNSDSSSEGSDGEADDWEAESNDRDEIEADKPGPGNCM